MIFDQISKEILEEINKNSGEKIEIEPLNLDLIKNKIYLHSSEKLCEMIVSSRYLGLNKDLISMCMEELAKRRENGDNFFFEDHIEKISKNLPDISFKKENGLDLQKIIQQALSVK
jgi:hypothetical protein